MSNKFEFTYSAPTEAQRREIEHIRSQYQQPSKNSNSLKELRELDHKVRSIPTCIGLVLGITGTLIFGLGLTLALEWGQFIFGIIVGAVGCLPIGFAYPTYVKLHAKLKNKYSDRILKLSEELLSENSNEQ